MPQLEKFHTSSLKWPPKIFCKFCTDWKHDIFWIPTCIKKSPNTQVSLYFSSKWTQNSTQIFPCRGIQNSDLIIKDTLLEYYFLQWKIWEIRQKNYSCNDFIHSIFCTNTKKITQNIFSEKRFMCFQNK